MGIIDKIKLWNFTRRGRIKYCADYDIKIKYWYFWYSNKKIWKMLREKSYGE